jgi:flagellar motility protein MotE (MotC chaperone)
MTAVEFQAEVVDGKIVVPEALREGMVGRLHVILFAEGSEQDPAQWPDRNRRRWELIAQKARQPLTAAETEELAALQRAADERLAQLGPRPAEHLERWYAERQGISSKAQTRQRG